MNGRRRDRRPRRPWRFHGAGAIECLLHAPGRVIYAGTCPDCDDDPSRRSARYPGARHEWDDPYAGTGHHRIGDPMVTEVIAMNEAGFWTRVRAVLNGPGLFARKLSDAFTAGTPDVLFVVDGRMGVIELKYIPRWPMRPTTPIRPGVTTEQTRYLAAIAAVGAPAFVLIGVADTWWLFGPTAVGDAMPQNMFRTTALAAGALRAMKNTLPDALRRAVENV